MATTRGQFDEKTKAEAVRKILAGEMTIQEAMSKYSVQSYQLHAWIGYVVVEQAAAARAVPAEMVRRMAEISSQQQPTMPGASPSTAAPTADGRAIVEWYIRNVVLKDQSGPSHPA